MGNQGLSHAAARITITAIKIQAVDAAGQHIEGQVNRVGGGGVFGLNILGTVKKEPLSLKAPAVNWQPIVSQFIYISSS